MVNTGSIIVLFEGHVIKNLIWRYSLAFYTLHGLEKIDCDQEQRLHHVVGSTQYHCLPTTRWKLSFMIVFFFRFVTGTQLPDDIIYNRIRCRELSRNVLTCENSDYNEFTTWSFPSSCQILYTFTSSFRKLKISYCRSPANLMYSKTVYWNPAFYETDRWSPTPGGTRACEHNNFSM